ncbi:preprotein translocase subunit Sec66 [Apiospora kogelbergensis]|uniref:Preprotein translocase subunit Sec66 n=1 Tax=Apiospora kogelbergensis TaxID=1337665 RepID=A0AAW0QW60_9PEZI
MFDVDWWSLALPFGYIFVLGSSLYVFSTIYRKRKAAESANLAPWFPAHLQKEVYSTLLELDADKDRKTKVPESVVRAALLRRAVEDIARIIQVRQAKQALNTLLQRGSVGEDLNQRFQRAEKEIEEELKDVVMEANALAPGWGQTIFQSANEIAANTVLRNRLDEIQNKSAAEKEWWDKRRETIQTEFMKELEEEPAKGSTKVSSDDDAVLVDSTTPVTTPSKKKKGKK